MGWVISRLTSGRIIPMVLRKEQGFPGTGSLPTFWASLGLRQ